MNKQWDKLWWNATLVTCESGYGLVYDGAIAVKDGKIAWLGTMEQLPQSPDELATNCYELQNRCLTPGFIDCHTHAVYAGNRANEFEMRLKGISYEEIARGGGGIQATVAATRAATAEELLRQSLTRVKNLLLSGVTTLEIKSGYGLDWETELKILLVAKQITELLPVTVVPTFLGAHTVPLEFKNNVTEYLNLICDEMIPKVAKEQLASAVDVFCEKIAFDLPQTERVFAAAKKYGLNVKCHAEQLSDSGSATLAAKYQALSVDHLEYVSEVGVKALAHAGTVAVLLPGAFYFLREKKYPPIEWLRQYQVPIAIASDCNPGTSPIASLLLILNMACTIFRLTPEEALLGVTKHAAKALGLEKTHGTLALGKAADFVIWDVKHPTELAYFMGMQPLYSIIKNGKCVNKNLF